MFRAKAGITSSLTILAFIALATASCAQPAGQPSDSELVEQAIQRASRYLLEYQLPDGGWAELSQYPGGVSSLVTLSLINSGQDPESPRIVKALQHLSSLNLDKTYCVALQTMVFCAANPSRYAQRIEANAAWLVNAQRPNGGWSYGQNIGSGSGDPSNSQFALLALHEAQRSGLTNIPAQKWNDVFRRSKQYWEGLQNQDGSFPYSGGDPGRGSMTCAGIASLIIVGAQLDSLEASAGDSIRCCGNTDDSQDRIDRAVAWLAKNFTVASNPNYQTYYLYYMYALERVGRLTGQRFIGEYDWYRAGASALLELQAPQTGEVVDRIRSAGGNSYSETALALLFLSKGKRQIVVSRLKYGLDNDWNHHATAIQNLTAHTEQAWKRDLAWQTIDLRRADVEDLLESPVLFISGTSTPAISQEQKRILKEYVDQGGFIFAEGCVGDGCDGKAFEDFFRRLVVELFDQPLEKISPDHPIWYAEARVHPEDLPEGTWLYGVQNCCRLGVVYCPTSLSCRWELFPAYGTKREDREPVVSRQLETFTKIGLNVLSYATGKELKQKLDTVTILEEKRPSIPTDRGVFLLPILQHNAGADDAARTTANLMQWFGQEMPFQLSSEKRLISIATESLREYPVVFMHGRGTLRLSEGQREALKTFFQDSSGFLFADAICADPDFAQSFRTEMEIILGTPLTPLPQDHAMLRAGEQGFGGFDIRSVTMIDPDRSGDKIVSAQRAISPKLEVAQVDNRIAVVFSPLDISCALESRHSLQCRGYVRDDAARIGINVLLFALQQP